MPSFAIILFVPLYVNKSHQLKNRILCSKFMPGIMFAEELQEALHEKEYKLEAYQ